jgi:hypothetical protein
VDADENRFPLHLGEHLWLARQHATRLFLHKVQKMDQSPAPATYKVLSVKALQWSAEGQVS